MLLPVIDRSTRLVERILPERGSPVPLTRCLDPAALATPIATVEAVRRMVARALETMCGSLAMVLTANLDASVRPRKDVVGVAEAADALRQAQEFMSEASTPDRRTSNSGLPAHCMRSTTSCLAETVREEAKSDPPLGG